MRLTSLIFLCAVTILFCSCDKSGKADNDNPDPGNGSGTYVAYSSGPQDNARDALLWHDGETTVLNDTFTSVYLDDIAIATNGDVYTTGCECWRSRYVYQINLTDSCFLILWKNKIKQELSRSAQNYYTQAYIRFAANGETVIAGSEISSGASGNQLIRIWKNGVRSDVTNGATDAVATCLYVSGNDVYIGGEQKNTAAYGPTAAVVWKNGTPSVLTGATYYSSVKAIAGSGTDIYVAVEQRGDSAWILKNGIKITSLPKLKLIEDIFVSGSDLYILGGTGTTANTVWKNGTLLYDLASPSGGNFPYGQRMYVKDGEAFVAGYVNVTGGETGVIWKNGKVLQTLAKSLIVSAGGIVVK